MSRTRKTRRSGVTLGLLQHACGPDPAENLATCLAAADRAAKDGAQILCTQELFRSQYFCQNEDHAHFGLAETIPGPSTEAFQKLARRRGVVIVASLFERRAPGLYHNTAVIIDADGTLLGRYRKMHIPDDPLFYEKFYFTPGDLGFRTWNTRFGRIGVLICWDQWYPEAARLTALQGAEILFYPTAIGWHPSEKAEYGERQHLAWETIQRSHAVANGLPVLRLSIATISSARDSSASAIFSNARWRSLGVESRHPTNASVADFIARSISALLETGALAYASPVEGFIRSLVLPELL